MSSEFVKNNVIMVLFMIEFVTNKLLYLDPLVFQKYKIFFQKKN